MAYRDEQEAMRARIEQLEGDLDEAHREIRRLRSPGGATVTAALSRDKSGTRMFGAPRRIRLRRTVDGEITPERLEALVGIFREGFGAAGTVTRRRGGLTWTLRPRVSSRRVEVSVVPRNGRTVIRATERLSNVVGGLFGGIVGGIGGGGLGVAIPITAFIAPVAVPIVAVLWLLTIYAVVRSAYRTTVIRRATELVSMVERVADATTEAIASNSSPPRARVVDADMEEAQPKELAVAARPLKANAR